MASLAPSPVHSDTSKTVISPGELSQRVAVLKRFKELLKTQRDRFRTYLDALDKQQEVIQRGTTDDLLHHVELEEMIVKDIFSIQKVIDPLEEMYQSVKMPVPGEDEVISLKEALQGLKAEALIRSEQNRELLGKRMAEIRAEIKTLQANPYTRRRKSGLDAPAPSQIDIKG